ncbi:MAG: hypothetical protein L3J29_01970 [Cyclobacteriaceae bacterium]|nr:hypothetical protein [Cyclobacteriaceae bacterium]
MNQFLTLFLFSLSITTFAQQVENVVATQQGTNVIITYDLDGSPNNAYYVKLLMSKNGQNFGQPLRHVTGDVGNAKAGSNKKIIWNAEKELSFYNGNAVFRVEATSLAAPMPPPTGNKPGLIRILKASQSDNKVNIVFTFSASNDGAIRIRDGLADSFIIDNRGIKAGVITGDFASDYLNKYVTVVEGIPIRGKMGFDKIAKNSSKIPMLAIKIQYKYVDYLYKFKNVPLSK